MTSTRRDISYLMVSREELQKMIEDYTSRPEVVKGDSGISVDKDGEYIPLGDIAVELGVSTSWLRKWTYKYSEVSLFKSKSKCNSLIIRAEDLRTLLDNWKEYHMPVEVKPGGFLK